MINGILEMRDKTVLDAMTKLEETYMLSVDQELSTDL